MRPPARWARPPAFLVAIAAVVATVGIGMTAVGSQTVGVTTDEPIHVRRLNHYLESGYYVRGFEIAKGPFAGGVPTGAYVYGPVTSIIQHNVNRLLDYESLPKAKTRPRNYAVRHAVIAAMAVTTILAVGAIAWLLLGSWTWGVVAGGILAAIPLWAGHGMFNVKDTPVATGHTLITLGLVLLALARPPTRLASLLLGAATLAAGTVLMLGTRPGMWPGLLASLVVFGVILVRARTEWTRAHLLQLVTTAALGLVASYGVLLAVYPRVFSTPITTMVISATGSADYTCRRECPATDRSYALVHLLTDLPLGLVAMMAVGTVAAVALLVVQRRRSIPLDCLALVGAQAFALLAAAIILHSHLYHGLRQLLFVLPALAVLAAVGLAVLITKARTVVHRRLVGVAAAFALVLPISVQITLFPYQYAYINVAAEQLGISTVEASDYYRASFREYARAAPQDVKVTCPFIRYGGTPKRTSVDCRTQGAGSLSAFWRGRPAPDRPATDEFYAIVHGIRPVPPHGFRPTPPNCQLHRQVQRWRNLETVVISRMYKCHPPTLAQREAARATVNKNRVAAGLPPRKFKPLTQPQPAAPTSASPTSGP